MATLRGSGLEFQVREERNRFGLGGALKFENFFVRGTLARVVSCWGLCSSECRLNCQCAKV
jgi:hypothetical protein